MEFIFILFHVKWWIPKYFLNPIEETVVAVTDLFIGYADTVTSDGARSKPHVFTNLYTIRNTIKLTNTKTTAVTNLANVFNPDSFGFNGRCVFC